MADVDILLGNKDSAWFAANPNHVLKDGQIVYLNDNSGKFKKGDGVTTLSSLPFIGGAQTLAEVLATGNKTNQTNIESNNGLWYNSIYDYYIEFGGVNGGYYKDEDGTVVTDATSVDIDSPIFTKQGVNVATENYVDTAVGTKEDSANKLTTMTGNTTSNIVFLTAKAIFDWATGLFELTSNKQNSLAVDGTGNKYATVDAVNAGLDLKQNIAQKIQTITSSATPTLTTTDDILRITAQAQNATFSAPTGTPIDGKSYVIEINDNGTARTLAYNSIFNFGATAPAITTTTIGKKTVICFVYLSTNNKYNHIGSLNDL